MLVAGLAAALAAGPEGKEKADAEALVREIRGAVVYARQGHIRKVVLGEWTPVDLGPGDFARWAPDGKRVAVWHRGDVYCVAADGSGRTKLVSGADQKDGCPVEFHTNNREIVYWKTKGGFHAVDVETGTTRSLGLPGTYSGSACFSADGSRMACRWGNGLFAVDVAKGTHRKYARGCSPGVSPDGRLLMNNNGGHRDATLRTWDGKRQTKITTKTMSPDRGWDNHHWSNHAEWIACEGEGKAHEAYVVHVSANRVWRVSWEGKVAYPDLWVAP